MDGETFDQGRAWVFELASALAADCGLTVRWREAGETPGVRVLEFLKEDSLRGELPFDDADEIEACAPRQAALSPAQEDVQAKIYLALARFAPWDDPRTGAH